MLFSQVNADRSISFYFNRQNGEQPLIAGSFSDWQGQSMVEIERGLWLHQTKPLLDGEVLYKFIINGHWITDPHNLTSDPVSGNSVLHVGTTRSSVHHCSFFSAALGTEKSYVVYLPPGYALSGERHYPMLMLMGGLFDYEMSWIKDGGIVAIVDELIASGEIQPLIVLMPDKDNHSFAEGDWTRYSAYLSRDIPGFCDAAFRVLPDGRYRGIEGLSLGGGWAQRIAAQIPGMFGSVSSMSSGMPDDVREMIETKKDEIIEAGVRFRYFCGTEEHGLIDHLSEVSRWMQDHGIPCEFYQDEGIHRWPLWIRGIRHSLRFHDFGFARV